jgi:hypothetical protein
MPRKEKIRILLELDSDDEFDKLLTTKKRHADRGGEFVWRIQNETGAKVKVELKGLPTAYLKVTTDNPITIRNNSDGFIRAEVINADSDDKTVSYGVYVNGTRLDPDLIIDGDGSQVPPGGKKKRGRRNKAPAKKKAAKKR